MGQKTVYVPIVKGKESDLSALARLSPETLRTVKPLIEMMPIEAEAEELAQGIHEFCRGILEYLPLGEIYVDFFGVFPEAKVDNESNAVIFGFEMLKNLGRSVTPVFGLDRNDDLWSELGTVARRFDRGFCFRLRREDLEVTASMILGVQ